MAKADRKHFGAGVQGKGDGTGAMTEAADLPENAVLSNRDKKERSKERGARRQERADGAASGPGREPA